MNVLLLSAGYGKRLFPLTKNNPKCLVKLNGITILDYWIEKLSKLKIKQIFINTHYLSDKVNTHIQKNYKNQKMNLIFEKSLLGTAGTLIKNYNYFKNDNLLLIHTDTYVEEDLSKFLLAHKSRPEKTEVTMMTFKTNYPESCGILEVDQKKRILKFFEKPNNPSSNIANAAVYLLSSSFMEIIKDEDYTDFSQQIIPKYLQYFFTYHTNKFVMDLGNINNLKQVRNFHKLKNFRT